MATVGCSAYNCGSRYGEDAVTFHKFPMEKEDLFTEWLAAVKRSNWTPSKNDCLCSKHFSDDKFIEKGGYRFLKYNAIPNKFHILPRPKALFPKDWLFRLFNLKEVEEGNFKGYAVEAKVAVSDEDQFFQWLKSHEALSKVAYKLAQRFPKINKQVAFKCEFKCRYTPDIGKSTSNPPCPAKLLVKIRAFNANALRPKDKDPLSYPCSVVLYHLHNHDVGSNILRDPKVVSPEEITEDTKSKFTEMFKGMYSPEFALQIYQKELEDEYMEKYDTYLQDKRIFPDLEWVKKFFEDCTSDYGEMTKEKMVDMLQAEVNLINGEKGKAKLHKIEEHVVVAICTSLMERAHSLTTAGEIVFVDNTTYTCANITCFVYVLMAYSCTEGLPLGVLVTTSDSQSILVSGIQLLLDLLPEKAFRTYGSVGPESFCIQDNDVLYDSFHAVLPDSGVVFSSFLILKKFWRWLWDKERNIDAEDCYQLYAMVVELMKAESVEDFSDSYNRTLQNETANKYPEFLTYFKSISAISEKWAVAFKNRLVDKEQDVCSLELTSYVLKDNMYFPKIYNMAQLFKFIADDMECYFKQKIIHCINSTLEKFIQFSYKLELRAVDDLTVEMVPAGLYKVSQKDGKFFIVDMNLWVCTCPLGIVGSRCKHQYAVCVSKLCTVSNLVPADEIIKKELHWIATNSVNSLFGAMEPGSGDSTIEGDDDEYNPQRETQKKFGKPKVSKKIPTQKDEARTILERIVRDIMQRYDSHPTGYHEGIVAMAVAYQSLISDNAIVDALKRFGTTDN